MIKILNLTALVLLSSGCATAYNSSRTELFEDGKRVAVIRERSWITSMASKSNANKAKAGAIELERTSTEAQPEVIKAAAEGAAKGATGNLLLLDDTPYVFPSGETKLPYEPPFDWLNNFHGYAY